MESNSTEAKQFSVALFASIQPALVEFYKTASKDYIALIRAVENRYKKLCTALESAKDLSERVEYQREFKHELLELLKKYSQNQGYTQFNNLYANIEEIANREFADYKRLIHFKEEFVDYPISLLENPLISVRKLFVNTKRSFVIFSKRVANIFRKVFKGKPIEVIVYRKRRVPVRSMAKQIATISFLAKSKHLFSKLLESQSKGLIDIWQLDEELNNEFQKDLIPQLLQDNKEVEEEKPSDDVFKRVKADQQTILKEIANEIEAIGAEVLSQFHTAIQTVDTLDLPYKSFGRKSFSFQKNKTIESYSIDYNRWLNSHNALLDDWSVDVEITLLYYSVFDEFNFLKGNIESYVKKGISGSFKKIRSYLSKTLKEIEGKAPSKKMLQEAIELERKRISNQLIDKILTQTIEDLTGCFAKDFNTLKCDTLKLVDKVSTRRGFIKNKNYLKGVDYSDVKFISPRELLNFEALPVFIERIDEIEKWVDMQLEKARINLMGLGTVCDFTLESAQIMLEQKKGTSKMVVDTVVDGFDRALGHLEKVEKILSTIQETIEKDISEAINDFDDDILKLKNTENILELNIKIARIKAVERTEAFKESILSSIRTAIPKAKEHFGRARTKVSAKIKELKLRIGIAEQKKYVSFELSEFIVQTHESLKKLPFVYQRLYQLNPTDEERFYVNRERELKVLQKSLENWKKDRFITVAIIGEKGSGITSLINFFIKRSEIDIPVIKHTLAYKIYTQELYFQFFSDLFDSEKFESNDQIIKYINQSSESKVIVIENLQHMFIKQVNGFDCMNMFFELMANTMKKVFWIGAYTTHSWNYLDKTIHISNYFTNEIFVDPLNKETIEKIIYKRNNLSGFQIVFQPDNYHLESKAFQNMGLRERQIFLRDQYFVRLRQMSSGNISLAQLYWLQSTQLANDDEIHISPISEFDFLFVKNLSSDELFTMQVLIIHDGLELDDYARVMGKPISNSRNILTPMLEKGLLIKPKSKFNINPIIFRPVANYLASRNFVN